MSITFIFEVLVTAILEYMGVPFLWETYIEALLLSIFSTSLVYLWKVKKEFWNSKGRFETIFKKGAIGIALVDGEGRPIESNPALQEMLGYTGEELCGMVFSEYTHPDDLLIDLELFKELVDGKRDSYQIEKRYIRKDGQVIWANLRVSLFSSASNESPHIIGMVEDITPLKINQQKLEEANEKLHRLSFMDGLTDVANRRFFDEYLDREWKRAVENKTPVLLILLDIDFFKNYNDTYGHQSGDECLKQVAIALKGTLKRSVDTIARFGGEEFAVVLPNTDLEGASIMAEALRSSVETLRIPHVQSKVSEYVTISVGVATIIPDLVSSPEELISAADKMLYQAKQEGRNRVKIYKLN